MRENAAHNLLDSIMDEYTKGSKQNPDIDDFLNDCFNLSEKDLKELEVIMERKGIDTIAKLSAALLNVGRDRIKKLMEEPAEKAAPTMRQAERAIHAGQKVNADYIEKLIRTHPHNKALEMVAMLDHQDQIKALNKAGIRLVGQLDLTNANQMMKIIDAVATVRTGISAGRGRGPGISVPMGGKAR